MPMLGAILTPHPPVLLPEVGRGREQEIHATDSAMRTAAEQVARWDPDVLIVASPHTIMYGDYFHIAPGRGAVGDMSAFGAPQVRIQVQYDVPLRDEIVSRAQAAGLRAGTLGQRDPALDHGVLIPLYFLRKGWSPPSCAWDCPAFLRWSITGWAGVWPKPQRLWDAGLCSWPAVTCPIN